MKMKVLVLSVLSVSLAAARPQLDVLHPPAVQEVEKQVQHILERGAMARAGEQRRASTGAIDVGKTPLNRSPSDTGGVRMDSEVQHGADRVERADLAPKPPRDQRCLGLLVMS